MLFFVMNGLMGHLSELWSGVFSSLFLKDGPVYTMVKEPIKDAFILLPLLFGELVQLLLWPSHRYFRSSLSFCFMMVAPILLLLWRGSITCKDNDQ